MAGVDLGRIVGGMAKEHLKNQNLS
jgi:hypothetical protein